MVRIHQHVDIAYPQYGRPPVEYSVLRVQVKFEHSLLRCGIGCECGTTSVYFGITYVSFILSRLPVFTVEPQYQLRDFSFLSKVSFEGHTQNLQNSSCWIKIWMGFVGQILIKLRTSSIWDFLLLPFDVLLGVTCANMLVTTQWPLKRASHLTSLVWVCAVWRPKSSFELAALCFRPFLQCVLQEI